MIQYQYNGRLRQYQRDIIDLNKNLMFLAARTGKTFTSLEQTRKNYPDKKIIVITTKSIMEASMHPLTKDGWYQEAKMSYGDNFEMVKFIPKLNKTTNEYNLNKIKNNKEIKQYLNNKSLITNNDYTKILLLLEFDKLGIINLDDYVLIIDEVHKLKNPGIVKKKKKSKKNPLGYIIEGKAGYYVKDLASKCYGKPLMLSATPSTIGFRDYANYLIMLGEYSSIQDFDDQHTNYKEQYIATPRGATTIQVIDHKNYTNVKKIMCLVHKHACIINRNNPILLKEMGDKPPHSSQYFKNHTKLKGFLNTNYMEDRYGNEMRVEPHNIYRRARQLSYDIFNTKNDKITYIMEKQESSKRVTIYYRFNEDFITLHKAFEEKNKKLSIDDTEYVHIRAIRGQSDVGIDYINFEREEFRKYDNAVLLVQYDAGSEGITLYDVCATIVHYTLPDKYDQFVQSSARTDGPVEGRYGYSNVIILLSEFEKQILNSLNNKEDFDMTRYKLVNGEFVK